MAKSNVLFRRSRISRRATSGTLSSDVPQHPTAQWVFPCSAQHGKIAEDKSSMSPGQTLVQDVTTVKMREDYRGKMKGNHDRRHQVVAPEELLPGDKVWIPDQKKEGKIVRNHEAPRSVIKTSDGGLLRKKSTDGQVVVPANSSS